LAQGAPLVLVLGYQINQTAAERGYQLARLRRAAAFADRI
jgi:hypothetical protein